METRKKIAVIMGSDSDWPVVKAACAELKKLDIPYEAHILSAHRTPAEAAAFAKAARAEMAQQIAKKEAALQEELASL